ncbi:MAG TPA: histidine kinase dimerization/phosphoacceptor domain -containing protein [Microvirga sp.]|nr:histidine kinase dimerization/phosphoacceptor domain -containing protein [Microvirga sp.]
MENLLRLLPSSPTSTLARYALTTLIVLVFFLIRLGLPLGEGYPFLVFFPAVFLSSILFDRGSGFLATSLTTILAVYFFIEPRYSLVPPVAQVPALVLYVLISCGIAVLSEALRRALERAQKAEREKDLLFQELSHRTKNNLQIIASVLALQARSLEDPEVRKIFDSAVTRVRVIANAHSQLQSNGDRSRVNMRTYLEDLCRDLGDSLRGVRPVAVRVEADPIELGTEKAVPVGLIVNELVTNAFKYAFRDGQEGAVTVSFRRSAAGEVRLVVEDNGVGCPVSVREGLGSRLVRLLIQQIGGSIAREPGEPGCRVVATLSV